MDWVGVQASLITVEHSVGIILEVVLPHHTSPHVEEVIHHSTCQALDLETVKISGFLLVRTALFLVSNLLIQIINTKSLWLIATYPFTQSLPGTLSLKGLGRPRLFRK